MAPTPGDDDHDDRDNSKQYGPAQTINIPTIITSTYTDPPKHTTTAIAYMINSFIDQDGPHTYTISTITDLSYASVVAFSLEEARENFSNAGFPSAAMTSYYGSFQASPTSAQYESVQPTPLSTSNTAAAVGSPADSSPPGPPPPPPKHGGGPPVAAITAGIIVPIFVCISTIAICIVCVRHYRRKARKAQAMGLANRMEGQEMKSAATAPPMIVRESRAYIAPSNGPPPPAASSGGAASSTPAGAEPPVIISTTMNNTYFTGIDTSDHVSISDDRRSMASRETYGEEPPPPYRPRSVPPISRDTSVRSAMTATPMRHASIRSSGCERLSGGSTRRNEMRSPFDDPEEEDEDNISDVETLRDQPRRSLGEMSAVSAMSYQRDSTEPRSTL